MEIQNERALNALRELPASKSCKLIDFDKAEVRPGFVSGTFILIVRGNAPCLDMKVQLMPLVYVQQPEYWEIEVVGCLPGPFCIDESRPFTESLALDGIRGKRGIEVVGANKRQRIELPRRG